VSVVHLLLIVGVLSLIVALYLGGRLHSAGHVVTVAVLSTTINGTHHPQRFYQIWWKLADFFRSAVGRLKTISCLCTCLLLAVLLGDVMAVCRWSLGESASNQLDTAGVVS